ncbi:MAG: YabP/YqfC family sporulation protein [Bacillota bacterium]
MGEKRSGKIGAALVKLLDLPRDVVFSIPHLQIIGNEYLKLENHRGIIEYCDTVLRIGTGYGEIKVAGAGFVLRKADKEVITFSGKIRLIEMVDWREG